jgi:hypothetical protein
MTTFALAIFALAVSTLPSSPPRDIRQASKPVKTYGIYTYFYGPPDSLAKMISDADAVVRGKIVGNAPRDLDLGDIPKARVTTVYRFKVLEIIHALGGYNVDPTEIFVLREGGVRDRGDHLERVVEDRFPPFDQGHQYILFLRWDKTLNVWVPAFGPDSVLDIETGRVESPGSAKVTKEQKGRTATEVLERIRRYGR